MDPKNYKIELFLQELDLDYVGFSDGAYGTSVPTTRYVDYVTGEQNALLIIQIDNGNLQVFVQDCFDLATAKFPAIGLAAALSANSGLLSPVFDIDSEHETIFCKKLVNLDRGLIDAVEFRMLLTSVIRFLEQTCQTIDIAFHTGMLPKKLSATFEELQVLIDEVGGLDALKEQFRMEGLM